MATRPILTTTLLTTTALLAAGILYLRHHHRTLRSQITTRAVSASDRKHLSSLPQDLLDNADQYRILHEQDTIPLPSTVAAYLQTLRTSTSQAQILTTLLRRNMHFFSTRLPQAYLMRLLAQDAEQKRSFSPSHIQTLDFKPGDLACGFYRVLHREPLRCEMGLAAAAPSLPGSLGGRLVTAIVSAGGGHVGEGEREGLVLQTETLQWVKRTEDMVLPLERGSVCWMHEVASWGCLVSNREWLEEEAGRKKG